MKSLIIIKGLLLFLLSLLYFFVLPIFYKLQETKIELAIEKLDKTYHQFVRLNDQDNLKTKYGKEFSEYLRQDWIVEEFTTVQAKWLDRFLVMEKLFGIIDLKIRFIDSVNINVNKFHYFGELDKNLKQRPKAVYFPILITFSLKNANSLLAILDFINTKNDIVFNKCNLSKQNSNNPFIDIQCELLLPKITLNNS